MNWRLIFDVGMVLYLFVIFLWVQHAMIQLTQLKRKVNELQWSLRITNDLTAGSSGTWPPKRD